MSGAAWRWAGRALVLMLIALLVLATARGLGVRWDPLGWEARRAAARERMLADARADARGRALEAGGERAQTRRRLAVQARADAARAAADRTLDDIGDAHDTPLDPDRLERLRALDRELCDLAPELAGCAAAP